jgi:hypothetical protein
MAVASPMSELVAVARRRQAAAGASSVAQLLASQPSLTELRLDENRLHDGGLSAVMAAARTHPALRTLSAGACRVLDPGLKLQLAALVSELAAGTAPKRRHREWVRDGHGHGVELEAGARAPTDVVTSGDTDGSSGDSETGSAADAVKATSVSAAAVAHARGSSRAIRAGVRFAPDVYAFRPGALGAAPTGRGEGLGASGAMIVEGADDVGCQGGSEEAMRGGMLCPQPAGAVRSTECGHAAADVGSAAWPRRRVGSRFPLEVYGMAVAAEDEHGVAKGAAGAGAASSRMPVGAGKGACGPVTTLVTTHSGRSSSEELHLVRQSPAVVPGPAGPVGNVEGPCCDEHSGVVMGAMGGGGGGSALQQQHHHHHNNNNGVAMDCEASAAGAACEGAPGIRGGACGLPAVAAACTPGSTPCQGGHLPGETGEWGLTAELRAHAATQRHQWRPALPVRVTAPGVGAAGWSPMAGHGSAASTPASASGGMHPFRDMRRGFGRAMDAEGVALAVEPLRQVNRHSLGVPGNSGAYVQDVAMDASEAAAGRSAVEGRGTSPPMAIGLAAGDGAGAGMRVHMGGPRSPCGGGHSGAALCASDLAASASAADDSGGGASHQGQGGAAGAGAGPPQQPGARGALLASAASAALCSSSAPQPRGDGSAGGSGALRAASSVRMYRPSASDFGMPLMTVRPSASKKRSYKPLTEEQQQVFDNF